MGTSEGSALGPVNNSLFGEYDTGIACASAVILVVVISAIDKATGYDLRLVILQLVPVAIVTWAAGRVWGLLTAVIAVGIWVVMFRGNHHYAANFFHYWDGVVMLGTFAVVVSLLARLREALRDSDARFTAALDAVDEAAYVVDPADGRILFSNGRFRERFDAETAPRQPWREREIHWADGHVVTLRVLAGKLS